MPNSSLGIRNLFLSADPPSSGPFSTSDLRLNKLRRSGRVLSVLIKLNYLSPLGFASIMINCAKDLEHVKADNPEFLAYLLLE